MKKTLHFSNYIQFVKKGIFLILFVLSSIIGFGQTITPTKTVTVRPGVCGKIDVELKIQGANPVSRPLEVVVVMDVSGSMDDDIQNDPNIPLDYAQDAAIDFINKTFLPANNPTGNNKIAIVKYSSSGSIVKHLLPAANKQELIDAINGLNANGSTNIEDGLLKADEELTNKGTFDCITSRSIVLLTDGVATRNVASGDNCSGGQNGTCIQSAITAANNAKTTTVSSVVYNNQIFSVGLFGAISGTEQTNAEFALNGIQSGGSFFTESGANLTGIYNQIFTQLSWVAQQINGTPFDKETVSNDFIIGTITPSKGTTSVSGQIISWNIDFLNVETITLKYELTPKANVCGSKTVSSSRLDYKNSACAAAFLDIATPSTNIPCPTVILASQTNVKCFGDSTGSITINNATGGASPYTYAWKKGGSAYATTQNLTGLGAGTYTVIATDANGCASSELSVIITQPASALTVAKTSQTDVLCYGASTGAINITASGGTTDYTYDWADLAGTNDVEDRTGLAAGTYTVTVKDANGCSTAALSITIEQPASAVAVAKTSQTDVLCYGASTGAINITASGGTGAYTYDWADLAGTNDVEDRTGLAAGTYTVTVKDANGCSTAALSITIEQPALAVAVAKTSQTDVLCYGASTGAINITASGGTADYTYDWADLAGTNDVEDRTGLTAGTYTVTVKDANGCSTAALSITIEQPASAVAVAKTSQTDVLCYGASTGAINITASGGTGVYTYDWADLAGTNDIEDRTGLTAGTYTVTVKDANGCSTAALSITIEQPASAVAVAKTSQTDVLCYGASTGAINITASGGTGAYTYDWADLAGTNDVEDRTGLTAGTYTVTVKDANGCSTAALSITIEQPASAVAVAKTSQTDVLCYGASTGAINITASGGTGAYTYDWADLAGTNDVEDRTGLTAGTYTVTVKDANGCSTAALSITIEQPASAVAVAKTSQTDVLCYGASTGAINITASGGTGAYTYDWADLAGTNDVEDRTGLAAGTYTVTVKDVNGCSTTALSITIEQPASAVVVAKTSQTDVLCYGASTGAINITASGGTGVYTYDWADLAGTNDIEDRTGLTAGTYTVTVKDANGCSTTALSITIEQPASAVAVVKTSQTDVFCYGASTGAINITASGGTGAYTYDWADLAGTNDVEDRTGLAAGTYTVTVKDANGCSTTALSITIGQPQSVLSCSVTQNKAVSSNGLSDGEATVTPLGGNGGYTYLWDNGETTAHAIGLNAGLHTVTVTDSKGCKTTCEITISEPNVLSCSITQNAPAKCYGDNNGKATVTAIGGNGDYTYLWDNGETTAQAVGLSAGSHTVTVTDKLGYKTTCNITIGQPQAALSATAIIINNNNCDGCSNGSINLTVSGGTMPYTFEWSNGATTEDISNLPSGTYSVEITDSKGCKANYTYVISESSIAITKDGTYVDSNQDGITNVGDVVSYNFVITNTGSVTLTNVTVTDNNAVITGGPIPTLAPGATDSTTFSGSHVITQADINIGYVYNLATATAKDPENENVTDTSSDPTPCTTCPIDPECPDCTITPLTQSPSINITKDGTYVDSNQDGITNVGDVVTYNFVIKNTGNVTLTNVTVTDNNAIITGGPIATLAVGATDSTTFSGSHVITQEDINTGYVYNLATATAQDPKGNPVTDTSSDPTPCTSCPIDPECPDCTITPLTQTPGLVIIKTATTASYSVVGDVINYTITVKNTGNATLHQITVKDPLTGLDTVIDVLAPGASSEYTQSYTVTQEDLNNGSVLNIATADGFTPKETPISDTDDEIVYEKANPIDAVDDNAGTIVGVNQTTPNVINVFTNDTLNALPVNPADVILTTVTSNPFLQMNPDGSIDVLPDAPVGVQTMTYQICEKLNNTNCDTAIVTVTIEGPSMTVTGEGICINDVPYFNYTSTANNFTPVDGLTLTWTDSNNNVVSTMTNLPLNGKVLWPGAIVDDNGNGIDWPGWLLVDGKWVEGADGFENLRPTASVTFTLNPSETIIVNYPPSDPFCTSRPTFKIDAVDDTAGPIDGINGAANILNIFNNDTLNTVAVNPADVTLTLVTPDATGYMTMNPDGSIDIKDGTPAGIYTLVYQICEIADQGNCDSATVTITVICNDATKIAGIVFNAGTNTPLANVPVNLVPQGTTTGPILIRITNAQGYYNFTGMVPGDYLVQVQDANLNAAYQLYPVNSSLFFTTLENCKYQTHDFGYDKSDLPVLGDFVWYDVNNNGLQDEWFDANNDGLVTKNIVDANGSFDYSKWEWIDLNGDGSYKGSLNVGELNAAGFGNAKSPNIFVTGPNDYAASVIIGIQGFWRNRPPVGAFGDYKVELKMDANLEAQSSAMGATGLVKVLPSTGKNANSPKTGKPTSFEVCGPTNGNPQTAAVTADNQVHLDIDFGISCKMYADITATSDTYSVTQCSIIEGIRNALSNDLLNGVVANPADLKFKLLTALGQYITIDDNGNISFIKGVAAGQYSFDYQVCEAANPTNCSTATITINVGAIDPVTITSPSFCNADTTPVDLLKLLPEGVPTDGTWVDTDNTGGLNGNTLNVFGLPINTYHFEYKVAGDCPRSIQLVMGINDDCKVLPCKTIIIHNAFSATEDGRNDYFQIENLEENDCYKNIRVEIFNRWGVLVFEKDNYNNGGNAFRGRSEGRTTINKNEGLPTGTYFYVLSYDTTDGLGKTQSVKKDGYLYLVK